MMHNPAHPGEVLKDAVIDALGISVTEAAQKLGLSRVALSRVLNAKAAVSTDLALRLEQAGVGTARSWLQMQLSYELWRASQGVRPQVSPLHESSI